MPLFFCAGVRMRFPAACSVLFLHMATGQFYSFKGLSTDRGGRCSCWGWYPSYSTPLYTLYSGYLLGISRGLLAGVEQLGYHHRVPPFSPMKACSVEGGFYLQARKPWRLSETAVDRIKKGLLIQETPVDSSKVRELPPFLIFFEYRVDPASPFTMHKRPIVQG